MHLVRFESHPVHTFTWEGRPCWLATQISSALGYDNRGFISSYVRSSWRDEFADGSDFLTLRGQIMKDFKRINGVLSKSDMPLFGASSSVILFESGVYKAITLSRKPAGTALRQVLADEILPQIAREGRYLPAASVPEQEALIDHVPAHIVLRELRIELESLEVVPAEHLASLSIRAAELQTGMDAADMFRHVPRPRLLVQGGDGGDAPQWRTATELGQLWGVHCNVVGRAANELGWREGGPGVKFMEERLPNGHLVNTRYFNRNAAEIIYRKLKAEGKLPTDK